MAKGNLLLGTAGNSVGDVVMYRREGAQVSRVRVRKVKNPKTAAQSTQRAFFAPVAKFYSPLSIVLERSYEGLSKSKSYSKFLKTNVDLARQNDWLLPKGTGFFPLPYKLSSGSLPSLSYSVDGSSSAINMNISGTAKSFANMGELSDEFIKLGYQNGDIVTIIAISGNDSNGYYPIVEQFILDSTSVATLNDTLKKFTSDFEGGPTAYWMIKAINATVVAGAVIVSRYQNDVWRRSTQRLVVSGSIITTISTADYKAAAIASYGATNTGDNPLVYLDGKELE